MHINMRKGVTLIREKRFEKVYSQNGGAVTIWVDKKTGVNYLYHSSGYSGGLTVLVDKDGKPIVTPVVYYRTK